jgi:hypothetical protein
MEKTKQLAETDIQRLKNWVKKLIPEHYDRVDVHSLADRTLTYSENQQIIRDHVGSQMRTFEEEKEHYEAVAERKEKEKRDQTLQAIEEYNNNLQYVQHDEIDAYYKDVHRMINKLCQGYSNLVLIKGRAGLGKSKNIRIALLENGKKPTIDFIELTGEVTEAYLYRLLYEHNGKIIWLRDVTKLLSSQSSLNLLKASTESEDLRLLTKSSYSKEQKDLPPSFECRCKFIFDYNQVVLPRELLADFEALESRGDYVELSFCDAEVEHIMTLIADEPWKKEVTEHLIRKYKESGILRLNLRTQWKAFNTYQYAVENKLDWKAELDSEMKRTNKTRALLYSLIGNERVRSAELKKKLLKLEIVNTIRTADNRVQDWLYTDELYKVSDDENNYYVSINPKSI